MDLKVTIEGRNGRSNPIKIVVPLDLCARKRQLPKKIVLPHENFMRRKFRSIFQDSLKASWEKQIKEALDDNNNGLIHADNAAKMT